MWTSAKGAENVEARRRDLLEKGFEVFSKRSIESASMQDIADAVGCGIASVYRYFRTKQIFVVSVATWKWEQFLAENKTRRPEKNFEGMTAAEIFNFFLDTFLLLYRDHRDMLRFNQFFNIYIETENIDPDVLKPYLEMIQRMGKQFHVMYQKAVQDKTIRTDEPEELMFSKTLHLMLAAATRYAVGLVYIPDKGFDPMEELLFQKDLFLMKYKTN